MLPARRHEITRVEAFSDAVFAFALTLLVVSLEVPDSYDKLIELMAGFVPFACSFALLTWLSASIGALATLVALTTPPPYPVFSGFTYFLMGPAHWIYGTRIGKRRKQMLTGMGAGDAAATT